MPYSSNQELPEQVKDNLPEHAQDIYRSAYNSAYEEHGDEADGEETSHKIAWSAVKQKYEKVDGVWRKIRG